MDIADFEVTWYKKHGKYPERIKTSRSGLVYVVGDFSWNMQNPDKLETIEFFMQAARAGK